MPEEKTAPAEASVHTGERGDVGPATGRTARHRLIGRAMRRDVVAVRRDTPLPQAAALLSAHRVSGMPVVDADDRVLGVLSRSDLVPWQSARSGGPGGLGRRLLQAAGLGSRDTVGALMSAPAVTARPGQNVVQAARTMVLHGVDRLPVVDEEERLTGIITRTDLLAVVLRPDSEIRREIEREVLHRALWLPPERATAYVIDGVVTLSGTVPRRSDSVLAQWMAERVDGVVDVVDALGYDEDDTHYGPAEPPRTTYTDSWSDRY